MRRRGFLSLLWASVQDLLDQRTGFGRLALVHVIMMAGDTLVTVSLAGSLFFSVSPTEAKGKVLAYLLLTIAPFAVVSPVLGPLIDRSANGRRFLVALSAIVRVVMCWYMAKHLSSLWLFPCAFLVLVSSKLYVVTRGALVPQMARTEQFHEHAAGIDDAGWPMESGGPGAGFAGFNAQLTLLGTVAGLIAGSLGAAVLKTLGAPAVLYLDVAVFSAGTLGALRLQRPRAVTAQHVDLPLEERDRLLLNPYGDSDVIWGLSASSLMRFGVGFASFLLAFGLRRDHANLGWYGAALMASALGSLLGLGAVTRLRRRLSESTLLATAVVGTGLGAAMASRHPSLFVQILFSGWLGVGAAIAQPSFDAITQSLVPAGAQGRTFAKFAVRQQLLWVLGALIPVGIALSFGVGDQFLAFVMIIGGLTYAGGRRLRNRGRSTARAASND